MIIAALLLAAAAPQASLYDRCMDSGDAANGIQPAMQACADQEYLRQDARLNQAYKMKMASLSAPRRPILRGMQRQWILDRDRRCRLRHEGSMARLDAANCLAGETEKRTAWLERYR